MTWGNEGSESHGTWGMKFQGVIPGLMRRFQQTSSEAARDQYRKFMSEQPCDAARASGFAPRACASLRVRQEHRRCDVDDRGEATTHFDARRRSARAQKRIAEGALREVTSRLSFLLNVGLDYLTLIARALR